MHEVMSVYGKDYRFDYDLVESRLRKIEGEESEQKKVIPKNAEMKSREEIILDFLDNRTISLRDMYWNALDRDLQFKMPRRPSCLEIAEYIKKVTNGMQTPDQSTVDRTIKASTNPKIPLALVQHHGYNLCTGLEKKKDGG